MKDVVMNTARGHPAGAFRSSANNPDEHKHSSAGSTHLAKAIKQTYENIEVVTVPLSLSQYLLQY